MLEDDQPRATLGLVVVPVVLGLALLTGGCNTMRGVGEDVQAAGSAMSGTAEDTEEAIEEEMDSEGEAAEKTEEEMMEEGTTGEQPQ
jgi:predicted small secreted protein